MNFKIRALCLIIFLLEEFKLISMASSESKDEYDITKELNDTIVGIFRSVEPQNVAKLIDTMKNVNNANNFTWKNNDNTTVPFRDVRVTEVISDETRIDYDFLNNQMNIRSPHFTLNLTGSVTLDNNSTLYFESKMDIRNITIKAFKQSNDGKAIRICTFDHGSLDMNLVINSRVNSTVYQMLDHIIPALILKSMNRNERLIHFLEKTYDIYTKKQITSKHAAFPDNEYQYHYLIPKATFATYVLKNIFIQGLSNFQGLFYTETPLTYTLMMKNIRGSFNLCSEPATSELYFFIDVLTINVGHKTNLIRVAAQNYTVTDAKTNAILSVLHSAVIMELMELTVAWSIMPSMEFQRTIKPRPTSNAQQMENTTDQIVTTTQLQTKLTRSTTQLPSKSSSQETTATTKLQPKTTQFPSKQILQEDTNSTIKSPVEIAPNPFNYDLLFNDVAVKLVSRNQSHPEQFECQLVNDLKFAHKVSAIPIGTKDNTTSIKFLANISSINIYVVKSNTSEDPDSCKFQIHVNQIIDVKSSPSTNTTIKSGIQYKLKRKINTVMKLLRNDTENIIRIIKPRVCSTLDVCSQSVKIAKNVFLNFVDTVLKKCWLRRITRISTVEISP